jgi:hypothetical protein
MDRPEWAARPNKLQLIKNKSLYEFESMLIKLLLFYKCLIDQNFFFEMAKYIINQVFAQDEQRPIKKNYIT